MSVSQVNEMMLRSVTGDLESCGWRLLHILQAGSSRVHGVALHTRVAIINCHVGANS